MLIFAWESDLPFREIKEINKVRKPFKNDSGRSWKHLFIFRLLLIHYFGPVFWDKTSHDGRFLNMHHSLILGLCVSRSGGTKMIGVCFYDYFQNLIFGSIPFFAVLYDTGSFIPAVIMFCAIIAFITFMSRQEIREHLTGAGMIYGFDK